MTSLSVPHSATRIILCLFSLFSPTETKHLKTRDHIFDFLQVHSVGHNHFARHKIGTQKMSVDLISKQE